MHKIAFLIGCILFSATTFAGTADIRASNNQLSVQTISTTVDYTETGNGIFGTATGTLDTETGDVPGSAITISTMSPVDNQYFEAEYDHSSGHTTYTGSLMGGTFGSVVSSSSALLVNYSVRYGEGFVIDSIGRATINDPFMLTPYVELGHHKWDRGVNYGELYTNNYFSLGTLWQFSPVNKLVFSVNLMLGTTFRSNIVVNSGPGLNGFSGALGKSTIYKGGLAADYAFTNHFHGNFGVDYTSFAYGISAVYPVGGGFVAWEPDSTTKYTTLRLGLGYAF